MMAIFFKRILNIILIIIAIVLSLCVGVNLVFSDTSFRLDKHKNILVLGDSHTACAINDRILERSVNLSSNGTAYIFTYSLLQNIIENNPQIDTLLLSFNSSSLLQSREDEWLSGYYLKSKINQFSCFMNTDELYPLLKKDFRHFIWGYITTPFQQKKNIINKIRYGDKMQITQLGIGRYTPQYKNNLEADTISRKNTISASKETPGTLQMLYLNKIIDYCNNRNIRIILFNAPIYNSRKYTDVSYFEEIRMTYYPHIDYLDYSDFPLSKDCYKDVGHLNNTGASIFSKYLQDYGLISSTAGQ